MGFLLNLLSCVKDSYLPALVVLVAACCCVLNIPESSSSLLTLHISFFGICAVNLVFLLFLKDIKRLFLLFVFFVLYIVETRLFSGENGLIFVQSIYWWIMLVMPLNLFLISSLEETDTKAFYLLCFFLGEAALLENICSSEFAVLPEIFRFISAVLWIVMFIYFLMMISIYPSIKNNAFFFECVLIFAALYQINEPRYFAVCLFSACLLDLAANVGAGIYGYFRDDVTGVYSKNSFPALNPRKLPPKYTIAFFCIDNYSKILKVFRKNLTDKLIKMVLKRMLSFNPNALVYRLEPDEFCFIFFEQDVRQTFDMVEEMRRIVAGTEFVLGRKKILKLTVTPVVSEKHRNDANAGAVLERMHKNFDQRYKFTQNMTFCEELEQMKKNKRTSRSVMTK